MYCSYCGAKLGLKTLNDGSDERYCRDCDKVFFQTPTPAVIVMVTDRNKVLLTRAAEWAHPYWGLVSGHVKLGETAEEAAAREVYEEVGLNIQDLTLLKTYLTKDQEHLMIAFKAGTKESAIKRSQELKEAAWFDLSKPLPMRPAAVSAQIVQYVFPQTAFRELQSDKTL